MSQSMHNSCITGSGYFPKAEEVRNEAHSLSTMYRAGVDEMRLYHICVSFVTFGGI